MTARELTRLQKVVEDFKIRLAEQESQQERLTLKVVDSSVLEAFARKTVDDALASEHVERVEAQEALEARMVGRYKKMSAHVAKLVVRLEENDNAGWENVEGIVTGLRSDAQEALSKAMELTDRMDTVESLAADMERANIQENGHRLKLEKRLEEHAQSITGLREDLESFDTGMKVSVNDMLQENRKEFGSLNARLDGMKCAINNILGAIETGRGLVLQPPPPDVPPPTTPPPPQPTFFQPVDMEELGM
jgi:hypothetical protein